ncbi:MAG: type II toxin-antitoxin system HicB family antitoxin [Dehalococcoidia bacterium]|nr:type II toxin-antitoxin system HicB family antitoxin [Dehalococcoidia bacterium]
MGLQRTIKAVVRRSDEFYVAECLEIPLVTQGHTVDETLSNLQEAVALHLEGEDLMALGLVPNPPIFVTLEPEPTLASA